MASELKHKTVGTELTQAEFEGVGLHVFDSQATGDTLYASSATQLSRLAKGTAGDSLIMGGSNIPAWNSAVQNDVTSSRAIDATVYENTSGRPLIVTINVQSSLSDLSDGGNSLVTIHCDSGSTPTTQIGVIGLTHNVGGATGTLYVGLTATFVVLPSYYYKATASNVVGGAAPTLLDWFEWEI